MSLIRLTFIVRSASFTGYKVGNVHTEVEPLAILFCFEKSLLTMLGPWILGACHSCCFVWNIWSDQADLTFAWCRHAVKPLQSGWLPTSHWRFTWRSWRTNLTCRSEGFWLLIPWHITYIICPFRDLERIYCTLIAFTFLLLSCLECKRQDLP